MVFVRSIVCRTDFQMLNIVLDRVQYSGERLAKIAQEATKKTSIVSVEDRMGLINDTVALAMASLTKTSDALELIKNFSWEKQRLFCFSFPFESLI